MGIFFLDNKYDFSEFFLSCKNKKNCRSKGETILGNCCLCHNIFLTICNGATINEIEKIKERDKEIDNYCKSILKNKMKQEKHRSED